MTAESKFVKYIPNDILSLVLCEGFNQVEYLRRHFGFRDILVDASDLYLLRPLVCPRFFPLSPSPSEVSTPISSESPSSVDSKSDLEL